MDVLSCFRREWAAVVAPQDTPDHCVLIHFRASMHLPRTSRRSVIAARTAPLADVVRTIGAFRAGLLKPSGKPTKSRWSTSAVSTIHRRSRPRRHSKVRPGNSRLPRRIPGHRIFLPQSNALEVTHSRLRRKASADPECPSPAVLGRMSPDPVQNLDACPAVSYATCIRRALLAILQGKPDSK